MSEHWYDSSGEPCYTQITKSGKNKGKERNTTLRDARKLNLVPSVTTILGVQAKPFLVTWQIEQALLAALTLPRLNKESDDAFMIRARIDSKTVAKESADIGTAIHDDIERGFNGEPMGQYRDAYYSVREVLEIVFPGEEWIAEASFCHPLGFGGKIDLHSKSGIFVDFKTKDNLDDKKESQLVFPDYGMQLSAYGKGKEYAFPKRLNIFIDRADCSKVKWHLWPQETHLRHEEMFTTLLRFWQLSKDYVPVIGTEVLH